MNGRLNFHHTPEWLAHSGARALSPSPPLQPAPIAARATRPFVAGPPPEGDKRKQVAQALQVSRQNDFGLLDGTWRP
ncbi:HipA N-terminal domain-containing protein [Rhodoferax sp. WC2427]|uniref:HipA N-terminal domain-containing protein n=1 Tax=Rhodoferax sp. WC2427 TaxID=3234144 RepID=UPI00346714F7